MSVRDRCPFVTGVRSRQVLLWMGQALGWDWPRHRPASAAGIARRRSMGRTYPSSTTQNPSPSNREPVDMRIDMCVGMRWGVVCAILKLSAEAVVMSTSHIPCAHNSHAHRRCRYRANRGSSEYRCREQLDNTVRLGLCRSPTTPKSVAIKSRAL